MTRKKCPRCGEWLRVYDGRDRTVRGGIWYEMRCPRCGYIQDVFKPRRSDYS